MLCASEIGLYHPVVARVKDYTRENTRRLFLIVQRKNVYVIHSPNNNYILYLLDLIENLDLQNFTIRSCTSIYKINTSLTHTSYMAPHTNLLGLLLYGSRRGFYTECFHCLLFEFFGICGNC